MTFCKSFLYVDNWSLSLWNCLVSHQAMWSELYETWEESKGKHKGEYIMIRLPCYIISINFVNKIVEYLLLENEESYTVLHGKDVSTILCWCRMFYTDAFFALDTWGTNGTYKSKKLILFLFKYSPYQKIFLMKVADFNKFSFIIRHWFYLW